VSFELHQTLELDDFWEPPRRRRSLLHCARLQKYRVDGRAGLSPTRVGHLLLAETRLVACRAVALVMSQCQNRPWDCHSGSGVDEL
jgi:hypothetical protein